MGLFDDETAAEVRRRLALLANPVSLVLFLSGEEDEAEASAHVVELADALAALAPEKVTVEKHDIGAAQLAFRYGVERAPAMVVEGTRDYGIRYYGAPHGYEFEGLIEVMSDVGRGDAELDPDLRRKVARVTRLLHIQVFVTPGCGYCPQAVRAAQRLAVVNDAIRADCIDATEFVELARRHQVSGVPKVVFTAEGGTPVEMLGAAPDEVFVEHALRAAGG